MEINKLTSASENSSLCFHVGLVFTFTRENNLRRSVVGTEMNFVDQQHNKHFA